jgi:chromosome segregation ATPase
MLTDDQSLQIFGEIVSKLEATVAANRSMNATLAEMRNALIKLNENQVALQQSSEEILLTAQRAEDRASRAEASWQKAELKIDALSQEVGKNNISFIESIARFNQLRLEWEAKSKEWDYRLRNIEESALPDLHETVQMAIADFDQRIHHHLAEIEARYLTIERYKDDRQEEEIADKEKKIQEYEGIFEQAKSLLKRGGGWVWGAAGAILVLVKDQIPWNEIWDWIVENLL